MSFDDVVFCFATPDAPALSDGLLLHAVDDGCLVEAGDAFVDGVVVTLFVGGVTKVFLHFTNKNSWFLLPQFYTVFCNNCNFNEIQCLLNAKAKHINESKRKWKQKKNIQIQKHHSYWLRILLYMI